MDNKQKPKEDDDKVLKAHWDYWKNEYNYWAGYLELIYGERDRFLRLYVAILTAAIAAIGYSVSHQKLPFIIALTFFIAILSIFIFIIVMYHRIRSTEYKKRIDKARGRLYALAQIEGIRDRPTAKYHNPKGADEILSHMLAGIAGISTVCSIGLLLWITPFKYQRLFCLLIPSAIIGLAIFLGLSIFWRNKLKEEDMKNPDPDLTQADEERCPKCNSTEVGRTGGSHEMMAMDRNIGFECLKCGHKFHIFEHRLKK